MEGGVLLRVESLQQCRRRIALEIGRELVYLVEDYHRIRGAGTAYAVEYPARQGSHIGLPVAPDFSFVVHAAQGNAHILAAQGPGYGLA